MIFSFYIVCLVKGWKTIFPKVKNNSPKSRKYFPFKRYATFFSLLLTSLTLPLIYLLLSTPIFPFLYNFSCKETNKEKLYIFYFFYNCVFPLNYFPWGIILPKNCFPLKQMEPERILGSEVIFFYYYFIIVKVMGLFYYFLLSTDIAMCALFTLFAHCFLIIYCDSYIRN